jgi:hypothetical protein
MFRLIGLTIVGFGVVLIGALVATVVVQGEQIGRLRDRVADLEALNHLQDQWCGGVERVNYLCETQWVDMLQRLGLDSKMMPLMSTALWRRATGHFSILKARKVLGGDSREIDKFLEPNDVLPSETGE